MPPAPMSASISRPLILAATARRAQGWVCEACRHRVELLSRRSLSTSRGKPALKGRGVLSLTGWRFPASQNRRFSRSAQKHAAPRRQAVLPEKPARTRFAPSPTGYLHIGGLRTALFSYLLAKRTGGQFLLRIEDTDQKRLVSGAEQRLFEDLTWAGLQWDEGPQVGGSYGPYKQSERVSIYQEHARLLLDNGTAYRCFCTPQTAGQGRAAYVTSGCYQNCASISSVEAQDRGESGKEPFTVRLKQPSDKVKRIYPDLIYGRITPLKRSPMAVASADDDASVDAADTILVKSDGTPTYHFANVVDDHLMQITHVIRGTEWMASTPLHYDLYRAFGWEPPAFAHVGLLLDENKAKLSKRNNADLALDVKSMRDEHGVLPETLINFLALLGWSNPTDNDVMDMQALVSNFDLKFTKGNTMVRMEKLWYLQKQHVTERCKKARSTGSLEPVQDTVCQIRDEVIKQYGMKVQSRFADEELLQQYCSDVLLADIKSYQNAAQYVQRNRYFFSFDLAEVPDPKTFYDKERTICAADLNHLVERCLDGVDSIVSSNAPRQVDRIDGISANIYASIDKQIWKHVLGAHSNDDLLIHPGVEAADMIKESLGTDLSEEEIGQMLGKKKSWNTALMRYLREKLSYGLPGPSIGVVMAILGYQDCCQRLGLKAKDAKTW